MYDENFEGSSGFLDFSSSKKKKKWKNISFRKQEESQDRNLEAFHSVSMNTITLNLSF